MKRRVFSLLVLIFVVCAILGLTACGHTHEYTTTTVVPTCTEQGYTIHKCACGDEYRDASVDALGHNYGSWKSNGDGTHIRECSYDSTHVETKNCPGSEATCIESVSCVVCNTVYGGRHAYGAWQSNGDGTHSRVCANNSMHKETESCLGGTATCVSLAECSTCGAGYGDFAEHVYTEYNSNETAFWYECSCGQIGEKKFFNKIADYVDFVVEVETGRDIRVLQLTDVQTLSYDQKRYDDRTAGTAAADVYSGYQRYIGQIIERYDPDLIIMTGDNTYGEFDDYGEQFLALIEFMDSFKIPWAPVFGNHDNESNMGVDWQCEQFERSEYCLFKQRELTGNGNYSVGLVQGGELKRVFYMLDSNGCSAMSEISFANGHSKKTVGFGQDQIDWYSQSMSTIKDIFPEAKFSMAFHIQISIFGDAFEKYGYNSSTIRNNPINLDNLASAAQAGDFGYIGRALKSPWDENHAVWNTIKKYGVDSIFVGHEHCNSASVMYDGVRLTYGQKSSTFDRYNILQANGTLVDSHSTGSGTPVMGGTFITLSEENGEIADIGLYLYDHDLGWEKPKDEDVSIDNIPSGATVTEFDFNGTDFNTATSTSTINTRVASKVADTSSVPDGFEGDVYSYTSDNLTCVGIDFPKTVNVDKLTAIFVKMYVSEYNVSSGKSPILRIYNSTQNSILSEATFESLGGEFGKWVYVDILGMIKSASGIVTDGKLEAFTLLYRFYGSSEGTVYFDSITVVSDGDFYESSNDSDKIGTVHGGKYNQHTASEFSNAGGKLNSESTIFMAINDDSYSVKFSLTPETFNGDLNFYGYTSASTPTAGIKVCLKSTGITIKNCSEAFNFVSNTTYEVEVGFVSLFNGNTVYVFVKVDGTLTAWELVECYGKTPGNIVIATNSAKDSFVVA